ncbi:MAG: histidine kinase [Eubacteriales bacterium]|nr:histidine kinase [Eubacteriales bacterium]
MFKAHSKIGGKIFKKFLLTYTVIFCILSALILGGTGILLLYNTSKSISSKIALITDVWDNFEITRQEQIYTLFSSDELVRNLQAWYRSPSNQNKERINLCLANFQTSFSGIQYLLMEDDEGTIFHSLNGFSPEIQSVLKNSPGYKSTQENGGSYLSPVEAAENPNMPAAYSNYTDRQTIYGHTVTVCFCYDAQGLVRDIKSAGEGLDSVEIYNTYGERLYGTPGSEIKSFSGITETGTGLFHCRFTKTGISMVNGSRNTLVYTMGTITYSHLFTNFFLLFFFLLGIYFVPILFALLYIIPANDKMLEPISNLSQQVQSFSLGAEPPLICESDDEVGELSHSFYNMAININQQSRKISEKEREKAETYYKLLTTQIDPHFIYNTMNIINILARQGAYEDIIKVNTALTRVLRERLNTQNTTFEEVKHEIDALKQYQLIMDYRYHSQVIVEYDINESVSEKKIPKNILQPLLENAYYHGLATDSGEIKGNIEILIYPLEDDLVIEISDSGKGFSEERLKEIRDNLLHATLHKEKEAHIGLENIYRRISYLYGENFSMDIQSEPGYGSSVVLTFPLDFAN